MKGTTICWNCQKATGGCSWADKFEPVKGWTAVRNDVIGGERHKNPIVFESYQVRKCPEYQAGRNKDKLMESEIPGLTSAVMKAAVDDWRKLCKGKKVDKESFQSLREFFKSEWAEALCGGLDPHMILARLEREKDEYKKPVRKM